MPQQLQHRHVDVVARCGENDAVEREGRKKQDQECGPGEMVPQERRNQECRKDSATVPAYRAAGRAGAGRMRKDGRAVSDVRRPRKRRKSEKQRQSDYLARTTVRSEIELIVTGTRRSILRIGSGIDANAVVLGRHGRHGDDSVSPGRGGTSRF